jgi:hypothetical protein
MMINDLRKEVYRHAFASWNSKSQIKYCLGVNLTKRVTSKYSS